MSVKQAIAQQANQRFADYMQQTLADRMMTIPQLNAIMGGGGTASALRRVLRGSARATSKTLTRLAVALKVDQAMLAALYDKPRAHRSKIKATASKSISLPIADKQALIPYQAPAELPRLVMQVDDAGLADLTINLRKLPLRDALNLINMLPGAAK